MQNTVRILTFVRGFLLKPNFQSRSIFMFACAYSHCVLHGKVSGVKGLKGASAVNGFWCHVSSSSRKCCWCKEVSDLPSASGAKVLV